MHAGARSVFPWLLDELVEHAELLPTVYHYQQAVQLITRSMDVYTPGVPRRQVMAVRGDTCCFAVAWEMSLQRQHILSQRVDEAMPSAASHVSPSAHVPAAAASPLAAPVMHAAAALPAHPDAAVHARMAVYLHRPPH
jgi:hypothetical protein